MTRSHPPFRQMRQFKAVAADWEYFLSLSDEGQLYCLSDRQVYILLVQCEYIGWLTRWYNTEDITQNTVQLVQSEVMNALMSCVDISVLVDQGKLNLTRDVQNQQIQSQGLRDIYADRYDGTPTSINPDAPTTNFGASGDRFDALCAALTAFVYQFANSQTQAVIAGDIAAFALLVGAALLLIPGLNLFYIAGASLALIAGGGIIGVTTEVAIAALTDTTALDAVICYMRDQLKDLSVTEANWSSVLDSYPFPVGSNAAIVADFIKPTLASNYLPVLDMLGQAYSGVINDEPLPECPCESGPWEYEWLPDEMFLAWEVGVGEEVSGVGFRSTGGGAYPYTVDVHLIPDWGISTLTEIEVLATSTTADPDSFRGVYFPGSAVPEQHGYEMSTGDYTMTFDVGEVAPPQISIQVSNNVAPPGVNTIRGITLRGNGPNPFS